MGELVYYLAAPAAATGIAFAGTATLIKACTNLLAHHPLALLTGWQFYALLTIGAVGLLLNQLAFQAGPLTASLPAITVVNPLLAVVLGVAVYDENLRHTPWAITTETAALLLLTAAAITLTRRQATTEPPPPAALTRPSDHYPTPGADRIKVSALDGADPRDTGAALRGEQQDGAAFVGLGARWRLGWARPSVTGP